MTLGNETWSGVGSVISSYTSRPLSPGTTVGEAVEDCFGGTSIRPFIERHSAGKKDQPDAECRSDRGQERTAELMPQREAAREAARRKRSDAMAGTWQSSWMPKHFPRRQGSLPRGFSNRSRCRRSAPIRISSLGSNSFSMAFPQQFRGRRRRLAPEGNQDSLLPFLIWSRAEGDA